jgi:hypothetical protein
MQTSTVLLIATLGAISVLLMLYVYIYTFENRLFLGLWFIGWAIVAVNYGLGCQYGYFFLYFGDTPDCSIYCFTNNPAFKRNRAYSAFLKEQRNEIERRSDQIAYLTFHDELTGLYNRAYFEKKIQELTKTTTACPSLCSLEI